MHDALALPGAIAATRYGFGWLDLSARATPRDYGVLASIYARADALPAPYAGSLLPLVEGRFGEDRASARTLWGHARDAILRR